MGLWPFEKGFISGTSSNGSYDKGYHDGYNGVSPASYKNNYYDGVMCVGSFTYAHVKPNALAEFVRITKNKGLICFTINEGIHEEYGFDKKIKELEDMNKWKKIEFFKSDYIASKDVNAWLGLYEVIK